MNTATWLTISVPADDVKAYCLAARVQDFDVDDDEIEQNSIDAAKATVEKFHDDWGDAAYQLMRLFPQIKRVQFWDAGQDENGNFGEVVCGGDFGLFDNNFIHG